MSGRWFKLLAGCASAFLALAVHAQGAPKVVFLSTADDVTPPLGGSGDTLVQNARTAFQAAIPAGANFVDLTNKLSASGNANSVAADLADAQLLILETVYAPADADRMAEVETALKTNPNLTVLAFVDGCCQQPANINTFVGYLNAIKPWGSAVGVTYISRTVSAPLNTTSLYRSTFSGLDPMVGGYYSSLSNVPNDYALYLDPAHAADTPPGAYGLFVPQAGSNRGAGACLFLTSDASPFVNTAQSTTIARAFMAAALDPNGACKQPAAGVVDLDVSLTGPASLTPGTPATYTLTVANEGVVASSATTVTVTLPAGLTVTGTPPAGCAATPGNTGLTCNVAALTAADPTAAPPVAGGSVSFPFQVVAAPGAAGGSAQAAVPAGAGEINTANNTTALPITVGAVPAAVPTLGTWALLALAGLMPLLASRRRRQV